MKNSVECQYISIGQPNCINLFANHTVYSYYCGLNVSMVENTVGHCISHVG